MTAAFTVRFEPDHQASTASSPVALSAAASACGIVVEQPCGGAGTCGNCRVCVSQGAPPPTPADTEHLSPADLAQGWRLGCQLVLDGPATIEVPAASRALDGKSFGGGEARPAVPRVECLAIEVPPASMDLQQSDLDRLAVAIGRTARALVATPTALRDLRKALRAGTSVSIAILGDRLLAVRGGAADWLGLAIDIGSTSLAAALVRLSTGEVVVSASRLNPQVALGADVISRLQLARDREDGQARLTGAVREGLAALAGDLLRASARDTGEVIAATVVGNPTMLHTWAAVDPSSLGEAPYVGGWSGELAARAAEVDLPIEPGACVWALPMIGSHVGADAVGAALACDMDRAERPTLLLDLGTNTELLLAARGRILATSAAAGPAFEGATIRHGMRAAPGAIDGLAIGPDGAVRATTIDGAPATGVCGSGLIDAIAELRRWNAVSPSGLLAAPDEVPASWPSTLRQRFGLVDRQRTFTLASPEASGRAGGVRLYASDVRQLQLVKGSILAAVFMLCEEAGVGPRDLEAILLAGAFGTFIRKRSALGIGLLPATEPERVHFVGNAAGVGARFALLDRERGRRAEAIAARAEYIELAGRPAYQQLFLGALAFPEA